MGSRSIQTIFALSLAFELFAFGCAVTPAQKATKSIARGKVLLEKKDYVRAGLEFKAAVQAMPNNADAYYYLGLASVGGNDLSIAIAAFKKATELNPKHVDAQLNFAKYLAMSPDKELVEEVAKRMNDILTAAPNNVGALEMLAFADFRLGRVEEAEEQLELALTTAPSQIRAAASLANVKLSRKDSAGAETVLKKAIEQSPQSAEAALALAQLYVQLKKMDRAEAEVARALSLQPSNVSALLTLVSIQLVQNQTAKAEETLKRVAALPDKRNNRLYGLFLVHNNRMDEAITEFKRLADASPNDREARTRLVQVYMAAKRTADAEKVISDAIRRNRKDADALLQRAELYMNVQRYTEAENDVQQVLRFDAASPLAHFILAKIQIRKSEPFNARRELMEAIRLDPNLLPARIALSKLLTSGGAAKNALQVINEAPAVQKRTIAWLTARNWTLFAIQDAPGELQRGIDAGLAAERSPELLLQNALLKVLKKDFAGARALAQEGLKQAPDNPQLLEVFATTFAFQGQMAQALEVLRSAAAANPKVAELQHMYGLWLMNSGKRNEGRAAFTAAKNVDPNFTAANLMLVEMDIQDGNNASARQILDDLLKSNPSRVDALAKLAEVETRSENRRAAVQKYRDLVNVDTQNVMALNNLGALLAKEDPTEAQKYAQRALELAPDDPNIQDTLGWIYYCKGLYPVAIKYLKEAVAKQPTPRHQLHLAMAYTKSGEQKLGQEILEQALKADPDVQKNEDRLVADAKR